MSKRVKFSNIVTLMLSIGVSIYISEIILFCLDAKSSQNKPLALKWAEIAEKNSLPFDTRNKYQVVTDFRKDRVRAYPFFNLYNYYSSAEVFPLGFISRGKTILCNETGEFVIYNSDEHGFNNPEGLYDKKALNTILIGDSFVHGYCVKPEETIAGLLRKNNEEVLNLGVGGSGPLYQLAVLKEYGQPFNPKAVFWFYYEGNDQKNLGWEKKKPILMKYLDKGFLQHLLYKQQTIDDYLISYIERSDLLFKLKIQENENIESNIENKKEKAIPKLLLSIMKLSALRSRLGVSGRCFSVIDPLFNDILNEAKRIVNESGGQLYFVYLPAWERYSGKYDLCGIRVLSTGKNEVLSAVKKLDIPVIDIQSVFDQHPDPLSLFPFRFSGHYNSEGYKLVAKEIKKYIDKSHTPKMQK